MCTSPLPLFPGTVLLGPDLVYFPQIQEPLSWPSPAFPPAGPGRGRFPPFFGVLSLKQSLGCAQLGRVGRAQIWGLASVIAAIAIRALSSAGNSCTRLSQQVRTGVPCPSPACPSCPPSPADSHSHPSPDAGDRLGHARDTLSFPSLLPLPGVTPTSSPFFTQSPQVPRTWRGGGWRSSQERSPQEAGCCGPGRLRPDAVTGTWVLQEHRVGRLAQAPM